MTLSPQDAGLWYELYTVGRDVHDRRTQSFEALERAITLAPDNLAVLSDWLLHKTESNDAAIVPKLEAALDILEPFSESIRLHIGADLSTLIQEAIAAARASDWAVVNARVRMITNVLRPEVAVRLDRKRLIRHELEYVTFDYASSRVQQAKAEPPPSDPIPVRFVEAPAEQQLPVMSGVRDAKLADFDLNGSLDVLIAREKRIEIYARPENAWRKIADLDLPVSATGLLAADLDRDAGPGQPDPDGNACGIADLDLIIFSPDGIVVIENVYQSGTGTRTLRVRPQTADFRALRGVLGVAIVDLDHDGDLDLAVSSGTGLSLWSNRGDFTFSDISARSALPPSDLRVSTLIPVDWNRTIDIDLVLAGDHGVAGLLENHRHGRLRWMERGFETLSGKALALGDFDANVSWDLVSAGERGLELLLTQTLDEGVVRTKSHLQISQDALEGVTTWDYDNDGYLDVLAWGRNGLSGWRGAPEAALEATKDLFTSTLAEIKHVEVADIDGDGDVDVLAVGEEGVVWLSNEGGNANHWLDIRLSGQSNADQKDERVNIHGVGSLLELKAGSLYQARVVSAAQTHFGLGARDAADVARVLWTNGIPQTEIQPSGVDL